MLQYDSLVADEEGMVLGGAVRLGPVAATPFMLDVSQFGVPARIQLCSVLAKSGSGAPSTEPPTLANTRVFARAAIEGAGRFCRIEHRTPGGHWRNYVLPPGEGSVLEAMSVEILMPYWDALQMPGPMSFVLHTPRGVRLIELAVPAPPRLDAEGRLLDVVDVYIPDCLRHRQRGGDGRWGLGWGWEKSDFKPEPFEQPDWTTNEPFARGLIVQLVLIEGLDAGELLRFRSASHEIEATADEAGRLALPVLLPLRANLPPAWLERADGRTLQHMVRVETAAFEPVVTLPGTLAGPPRVAMPGRLRLTLLEGRELVRHSLSPFGLRSVPLTRLNPQPLPPGPDDAGLAEALSAAGLRGLRGIIRIPGFAERGLAVAQTGEEGRMLLLDLAGPRPRVAGFMSGALGPLEMLDSFALLQQPAGMTVFRRVDLPVRALRAVRHEPAPKPLAAEASAT